MNWNIFRKQTETSLFKPYMEVKSISDAYDFAVKNVIAKHREVTTEDGEHTWQSDPFTICITEPWRPNVIHKNSPYGIKFFDKYASDIINGTPSEFVYTYHERLFKYRENYYDDIVSMFVPDEVYLYILDRTINQMDYIEEKLQNEPNSRRGLAITWEPKIDELKKDVPCLQFLQFWLEDNRLNMYVLFRSNDILLALLQNLMGLYTLQKYMAKKLGNKKIGKFWISETMPHLYNKRDANELKKWI
jgi:thymidylate synthase